MSRPAHHPLRADSAPPAEAVIGHEETAAHAQLSAMIDALFKAQAAIAEARATLRAMYAGPTASPEVESFLAAEAEDQDIVAHLADAARSLRATHAIVQAHRESFTASGRAPYEAVSGRTNT